jgi:hypothetical protein
MGGGGAAGKATKVLRYSSEQNELLGHPTIAAAVRGGTIAQRRDGDAAAKRQAPQQRRSPLVEVTASLVGLVDQG